MDTDILKGSFKKYIKKIIIIKYTRPNTFIRLIIFISIDLNVRRWNRLVPPTLRMCGNRFRFNSRMASQFRHHSNLRLFPSKNIFILSSHKLYFYSLL